MSVTSGYFNSKNGDRRYTAEQMSSIFNGIISDGVFANEGTAFSIAAAGGNSITIGVGRAWFDSTWIYNDSILTMPLDASDVLLNRYDAVVIEIDRSESVRSATIKIIKGETANEPVVPTMTDSGDFHQHPIAYIYRGADTSEITNDNIRYLVGTDVCPFITGVVDVNAAFIQWQVQWEFWFNSMKSMVGDVDLAALSARVLELEQKAQTRLFRGKNLGTSITNEQMAAIQSGAFTDLWLGDYWVIDDINWRIVDFDYWMSTGGNGNNYAVTKHHIVIMPDVTLKEGKMYYNDLVLVNTSSNTFNMVDETGRQIEFSDSGYVYSLMYTSGLHGAKAMVESIFGDKIMSHKELLSDKHMSLGPTSVGWYDSTVELPNQIMMYGNSVVIYHQPGWSRLSSSQTIDKTQLALFSVKPEFILAGRRKQWLRDPINENMFAFIDDNGDASYTKVSNTRGVRPIFAIG